MRMASDVAFRTLRPSAASLLLLLSLSCDQEPSAPNATENALRPAIQRITYARVIGPNEPVDLIPSAVAAWSVAGLADRLNTAFDVDGKRLWTIGPGTGQLAEVQAGPDGRVDLSTLKGIDVGSLRLRDPRGLTVDHRGERLFVLDAGPRIVRVDLHPLMGLRNPTTSVIDLATGLSNVRGIAFDPSSGHLHVLDPVTQRLYELSRSGEIVAMRDVSELGFHDLQGMTFAPSRDPTDDPEDTELYVSAGGKITEVSFAVTATATTTATATLVRTTHTSDYSPPSPDPSGLAYAVHLGKLIIVDGEVEEMSIYNGANAWETSLSGSSSRSWTTTSFSIEPVGAAYNSVNRHLYISDDDARKIFDIDPGADGVYGTSDDGVTSLDTRAYGSHDPEGLAYDAANRVLFIADGLGAELFRISAGSNGVFDGPPPGGDDQVSNFDLEVFGIRDPEGIAFDFDFGHLYIGGKPKDVLFHISQSGVLLRTIDVSAADPDGLAGLEYGPSSVNPGARSLYIVDRGEDNDSNPNENDGRMYEFSLPPLDGNTLPAVMITAPANGSLFGDSDVITFTGSASDLEDGDLTSSLLWTSNIDGAFGTGGSVSTSALAVGRHVITASVADGDGGGGSASIDIEVFPVGAGAAQVRISTGSDDVEESATGSLQVSSSDLELVFDGTDQLVGLRFTGVTVPRGATVTRAYVQFQTDEKTSAATSLTIQGQAADNALTFSSSNKVSPRARTASAVAWSPPAWNTVGQAGEDQQTPNIATVIQEIIDRPGWSSGNALALIITGTGARVAEAYEGDAAGAPMLRVEYSTLTNTEPTATDVVISGTPQVGQLLTGNYTYNDGEGDLEGTSTYRWLRDGTPITDATTQTYRPVTGDEGTMIVFEVTPVAGTGASPGEPVQSPAVGPVAAAVTNTAPTATDVAISGTPQVGHVLTGSYTYGDLEGDQEGTSTYRWLRNTAPISGATSQTYTLVSADEGALIAFEVTPVATSGTSPGSPTPSPAVGPIHGVGEGAVQVRVAMGSDDAEESATGSLQLRSSDLELVFDGSNQFVGLRFTEITVPRGATVGRAYVQFQTDEKTSEATSLTIQGEAADNPVTFSSSSKVSARPRTASSVAWSPPAWTTTGQAGADQQTPNIAAVIQEIINRPGWSSGNALALIITGTGVRTAEAFDGDAAGAPMLRVEYSTLPNTVPTATNVVISGTPQVGHTLTGNYTYNDGEGDLEGTSTYRWLRNGAAVGGATSRTYALGTADEGTMIVFEVTPVAGTGESPGEAVQSAAVEIMPAPTVSAALSTVDVTPTSIPAGSQSSTITVTVRDGSGAPIVGATVALSATGDGNTLTQPTDPTNTSGVATGSLSSTVIGTKTVSATANGTAITQTATVEVTEPPPAPPITHTLLTSGNDPVNQKVYTTASISPAPNALITLAIMGHRTPAASESPAISGGGMSEWTVVGTITFDDLSVPLKRITVYRAMSPSPGSGPITITFPDKNAQSHLQWIVSQWEGVDISGVNGSGAIVQTGSAAADEVNGLTVNLAPFSHVNNVAYGVFGVRKNSPGITPGDGFTEIIEHGSNESPPSALQAEWKLNDNTVDATWTNLRGAALAFEIKAQ